MRIAMRTLMLMITAFSLTLSNVATAQSFSGTGYNRPEAQLRLGLTIPIGRSRYVDRAPRVELGILRNRVDYSGRRIQASEPTRLALTLGPKQQVMLNGREFQGPVDENGNRRNISTIGAIGIGVGVFLLAGVIVVATSDCIPDLLDEC
jgi:hypothetical protein